MNLKDLNAKKFVVVEESSYMSNDDDCDKEQEAIERAKHYITDRGEEWCVIFKAHKIVRLKASPIVIETVK